MFDVGAYFAWPTLYFATWITSICASDQWVIVYLLGIIHAAGWSILKIQLFRSVIWLTRIDVAPFVRPKPRNVFHQVWIWIRQGLHLVWTTFRGVVDRAYAKILQMVRAGGDEFLLFSLAFVPFTQIAADCTVAMSWSEYRLRGTLAVTLGAAAQAVAISVWWGIFGSTIDVVLLRKLMLIIGLLPIALPLLRRIYKFFVH